MPPINVVEGRLCFAIMPTLGGAVAGDFAAREYSLQRARDSTAEWRRVVWCGPPDRPGPTPTQWRPTAVVTCSGRRRRRHRKSSVDCVPSAWATNSGELESRISARNDTLVPSYGERRTRAKRKRGFADKRGFGVFLLAASSEPPSLTFSEHLEAATDLSAWLTFWKIRQLEKRPALRFGQWFFIQLKTCGSKHTDIWCRLCYVSAALGY